MNHPLIYWHQDFQIILVIFHPLICFTRSTQYFSFSFNSEYFRPLGDTWLWARDEANVSEHSWFSSGVSAQQSKNDQLRRVFIWDLQIHTHGSLLPNQDAINHRLCCVAWSQVKEEKSERKEAWFRTRIQELILLTYSTLKSCLAWQTSSLFSVSPTYTLETYCSMSSRSPQVGHDLDSDSGGIFPAGFSFRLITGSNIQVVH